ncbi:MAG: FGGY family carbohydrate kinase [Lachnospiraceae bacterium]|nr:FGGY family carbohydrate kinase [Lachnospiraceae bacterium]
MSNYIGLDIGTTSVCAVCLGDEGKLLQSLSVSDPLPELKEAGHTALQDPQQIMERVRRLIEQIVKEEKMPFAMGISTQMHGIVYVDAAGKACSPLYTWQDACGNEVCEGETCSQRLSRLTGYQIAAGYGLCTHYYQILHHAVPENAVKICTIGDYVAMQLGGLDRPVMHPSNAAALGCFDIKNQRFDLEALSKAGICSEILPEIAGERMIGKTKEGIWIMSALGDNQASVYGSLKWTEKEEVYGAGGCGIQITVGTSAQISIVTDQCRTDSALELRPFLKGKYLLVGAALCGGYAWQLLRDFYMETAQLLGTEAASDIYEKMTEAARKVYEQQKQDETKNNCRKQLQADTHFLGSRKDPSQSGGFSGVTAHNFHPGEFCLAVLQGIVQELYTFYASEEENLRECQVIYGSGNGLRRNPVLVQLLQDRFGKEMRLMPAVEEAALGAAKAARDTAGLENLRQ